MSDARSNRKIRVVPFISLLEKDRQANLFNLINKAKKLKMEGFETIQWGETIWTINAGRLIKQTGKNASKASLNFHYPPKLTNTALSGEWADLIKALVLLRFHRNHQSASSHRMFITSIGYVAYEVLRHKQLIAGLNPEHLDQACRLIASHYSATTSYNMQKAISEFAAHCDANGLCKTHLSYRFSGMKRPESTFGVGYKRLDDPGTATTKSDKLISAHVFRILGELYQNVPKNHKYRFYVLILTLLACLGRRFSEITLLPNQKVNYDNEGRAYIEYFPRKTSQGDAFTPKRQLYLPTDTSEILTQVLSEIAESCSAPRTTANEMHRTKDIDLRFLADISDNQVLYKEDLAKLGLSATLLDSRGWLRIKGHATADNDKLTSHGNPTYFTTKSGVIKYCQKFFYRTLIAPIHIDQHGKKYYIKELLLVRYMGLSSGAYSHWIATPCSHSMMGTFLIKYFDPLVATYATSHTNVNFTSHHFRHTLNTLLDEGGLSDLLQTEWFGRTNPRDTKAYQHTSREKRALMLREDIKNGRVGGQIVDKLKSIPITVQDAFLKARINAVHDVGAGICVHNFVQTPCERHLQCSADCKDYVWVKDDKGRVDDLKRQYSMTSIARETAEKKSREKNAKRSIDWLTHNDKKIETLSKQLIDNNIAEFDPHQYLEELSNE